METFTKIAPNNNPQKECDAQISETCYVSHFLLYICFLITYYHTFSYSLINIIICQQRSRLLIRVTGSLK